MKCIDLQHELSHYNLRGKWNDYIGVQKEVISVLKQDAFLKKMIS